MPSLSPSSPSRSWDLEEDRRRQEKWQEEQERLLQVKTASCVSAEPKFSPRRASSCFFFLSLFISGKAQYQRDQERLEAEWQQARRDAASELHAEAEVP